MCLQEHDQLIQHDSWPPSHFFLEVGARRLCAGHVCARRSRLAAADPQPVNEDKKKDHEAPWTSTMPANAPAAAKRSTSFGAHSSCSPCAAPCAVRRSQQAAPLRIYRQKEGRGVRRFPELGGLDNASNRFTVGRRTLFRRPTRHGSPSSRKTKAGVVVCGKHRPFSSRSARSWRIMSMGKQGDGLGDDWPGPGTPQHPLVSYNSLIKLIAYRHSRLTFLQSAKAHKVKAKRPGTAT